MKISSKRHPNNHSQQVIRLGGPQQDSRGDGVLEEEQVLQVLFLGDIFPTGYIAAENADIQPIPGSGYMKRVPGVTVHSRPILAHSW
jgi:hypothetical protein